MPLSSEIREQIEAVRLLVREAATEMAAEDNSIQTIALAGSWALGVPSPVDIDLVVIFKNDSETNKYQQQEPKFVSGYRLDLHCYSSSRIEDRMFKRKTNLSVVKSARLATRKLRHFPGLKKFMIKCLGKGLIFFKSYEITPQADQILIPLVDKDNYLSSLQKTQRAKLVQELGGCEMTLHQPDGFYLLLQEYLHDGFSQQELRPVLLDFYGDSKEFLQRIIQCYDTDDSQKLISLYEYIYNQPPERIPVIQGVSQSIDNR